MNERKIIYITKKALENLPIDIPVYILIDPETELTVNEKPQQSQINDDKFPTDNDPHNRFIDSPNDLNIIDRDLSRPKSSCDFLDNSNSDYEIANIGDNTVLESSSSSHLISQSDFNHDDFINSVDIIASDPTEIAIYDQIKTPEYPSFYHDSNDAFINDFYDCLSPDNVISSTPTSFAPQSSICSSSTNFIADSVDSLTKSNDLFSICPIDSCFPSTNSLDNPEISSDNRQTPFPFPEIDSINHSFLNKQSSLSLDFKPDSFSSTADSINAPLSIPDLSFFNPNYDLPNPFMPISEPIGNGCGFEATRKTIGSIDFSGTIFRPNQSPPVWNIGMIDFTKPPPAFKPMPQAPFQVPMSMSIPPPLPPPPPIRESPTGNSTEIAKIKFRRSTKRKPKKFLCFKEYQFVDMHIDERYLVRLNKKKKTVLGTKSMTIMEDKFESEILSRREKALSVLPKWEPIDRTQFAKKSNILDEIDIEDDKATDRSNGSDNDSIISDLINSDSEEDLRNICKESNFTKYQMNQLAHIEKKVAATRRRLNLDSSLNPQVPKNKNNFNVRRRHKNLSSDQHVPAKKAKQSTGYLTIQKNNLHNNAPVISNGRTIEQQAEINHKLKHPLKLHSDIWFNETNELNDGPACSCSPKYQMGPLHNNFPGEKAIPLCQSNSNNYGKLFHYKLVISPVSNFLSETPTVINYKNKEYSFAGFSIFTHKALVDIPPCQVVRYNIVYFLSLVKEDFPIGFTVRTLDLITDYIFTELLELLDLQWWPFNTDSTTSCRAIHLLPRFERPCPNNSVELLPGNVVLKWLLKHAEKPLFDVMDLPRIHSMSQSEWSEYIDSLRGSLATFPGKKPAAIRIDQIDRISIEKKHNDEVMIFPVIVHMSMAPMKLGLTREPAYKRLLRNFLKLQYLILNRPEVTQEDRAELNNLARLLENFEMNGIQRREFTVEISSDGFFRTGLFTDVVQFALCIPSIMTHIRFHLSLSELENRLKYAFKDKSLLHQALTHPSFRNTNYGTNPDHYQNTVTNCGLRHIEYGDKISLYRSFRKKGLSKMVQVMSHMPYRHETRSNIFGNERLECLGDAVIELITSVHLFYMFPELSEGHLDAFRQSLVQNHYLAELAVRLGFHNYILYTHNMDFSYDSTITHARSDGFEAVMAAITLDGGLDEADRIFGSALFADDSRIHKVWCEIPLHPLQEQFPNGDRHVIRNSPLFENLTKLEDRLGIQFKHIRLLAKAMTIRKTGFNLFTLGDNQRLEFLGDSLLKYLTTDYLFKHFPRHHEGHISLLRNTLVNRYTQATVCTELGLDEFIIRKDSNKSTSTINKSNEKPKADLLEAFLGALFVDKDLKWVERFCQVCFWPRLVDFILNQSWNDPKSRLQQCCLTYRSLNEDPEIAHYKLITTFGSTDHREFKVAVYFRGVRLATGFGRSIQIAQMNAASQALETYKTEFRQLNYQEKVISDHYDYNTREKIMHQFENWDSELIDKFVSNDSDLKPMNKKLVPKSNLDYSTNKISVNCEKSKDRLKSIAFTSSLGDLLKNMKKQ